MVCTAPANAEPAPFETIEELFAALESPLLAYALRLVGERGPAEDITQEAFMRLHAQFAEVREPRRPCHKKARLQTKSLLVVPVFFVSRLVVVEFLFLHVTSLSIPTCRI